MFTVLKRVFSVGKLPGLTVDMLVFVDLDSLANNARFDKLFDVSPKAWPDVSVSGHFDCLLLTGMHVFVQCFYSCLPVCWWEQKDSAGGDVRDLCLSQQLKRTSPFLCPREIWS